MQRVISFLVVNEPGVLSRVSGLLSKRGFNVESIAAGITDDPSITRITLMMFADDRIVEQLTKQLNKLLDVKAIREINNTYSTLRELALVKINIEGHDKKEIMDDVANLSGIVVDMGENTATVQFASSYEKINKAIENLKCYGIVEVARTGTVALDSGDNKLSE